MDYEKQQYIENILIDLLSYEESLEFKNDQDKIYINGKIDHLINILNQYMDDISSNEYEYNMISNWTREKYEYYKLQQAKKRLSLFKLENVLRHEPGVFKNIAKHYSNLPVQKSVLNKYDSDLDMELDSNDLDDIYNTLKGGSRKKRTKKKIQKGGAHLGPRPNDYTLLGDFARYWWNMGKSVSWSNGQSGYYFTNLYNNYLSPIHVHIFSTSTETYPSYFNISTKKYKHNSREIIRMYNIYDAYQKITQLNYDLIHDLIDIHNLYDYSI